MGNRDEIIGPHNCYCCKGDDKWISIPIATDEEWRLFCEAIRNSEWTKNAKYSDPYLRKKNEYELDSHISDWTIGFTHIEVMEKLQKANIAAMPLFNNAELFEDSHFITRERTIEL